MRHPNLSCCLPPSPSPETDPCSFFLFLPGLNKDLVEAESLKPQIRVQAVPSSPQAGTLLSWEQGISWKRPGATWSWLGAWAVKARGRASGQSSRDSHSVNLAKTLLLLFQQAPAPHPIPSHILVGTPKIGLDRLLGRNMKVRHG